MAASSGLLRGSSDQRKQTGPEPGKLEACEEVRSWCVLTSPHATLKEERLPGYDRKTGHLTDGDKLILAHLQRRAHVESAAPENHLKSSASEADKASFLNRFGCKGWVGRKVY